MTRMLNLSMIVLMLVGAVSVYTIKNRSEAVDRRIVELRTLIKEENQAITDLKAEWAVMRQPPLLQQQVDRYQERLNLQPLEPIQFGAVASLPERPMTIELLINKSLGELFEQSEGAVQ